MNKDKQIEEIFETIQLDLKRKFGLELDVDVIEAIVDTQFKIVPEAMANKDSVKINYLGRFCIKPGREEALNSYIEVHKNKSLLEEERVNILKARATSSRLERKVFKEKIIINTNETI